MQVRHDMSMVERAVAVVTERAAIPVHEAVAHNNRVRLLAEARRLLAVGCAIAIAAIGLGIGVGLALGWTDTKARSSSDTARIREAVSRIEGGLPAGAVPVGAEPTLDFSIFRNVPITLFDRSWFLTAGHKFLSSEDAGWANAWCYLLIEKDGVQIQLDLAERAAPGSGPSSPRQTPQTLRAFDLTAEQVKLLAGHCPWLESNAH